MAQFRDVTMNIPLLCTGVKGFSEYCTFVEQNGLMNQAIGNWLHLGEGEPHHVIQIQESTK